MLAKKITYKYKVMAEKIVRSKIVNKSLLTAKSKEKKMIDKEYYTIGEVSKKYGISTKTLRYYDKIGLLVPSKRKEKSEYRFYSKNDMLRLSTLRYYKNKCGLSLEEIRKNLETEDPKELIASFKASEEKKLSEIQQLLLSKDDITAWKLLLEEGCKYIKRKDNPIYIRVMKEINTLSYYTVTGKFGESYWATERKRPTESASFGKIAAETNQYLYGAIYSDFASAEKRMNYIDQPTFRHMEIHPSTYNGLFATTLGGYPVVSAVHIGDFNNIHKTYEKALKWIEENEIVIQGNSIERYLIDRQSISNSNYFVAEILFPVKNLSKKVD